MLRRALVRHIAHRRLLPAARSGRRRIRDTLAVGGASGDSPVDGTDTDRHRGRTCSTSVLATSPRHHNTGIPTSGIIASSTTRKRTPEAIASAADSADPRCQMLGLPQVRMLPLHSSSSGAGSEPPTTPRARWFGPPSRDVTSPRSGMLSESAKQAGVPPTADRSFRVTRGCRTAPGSGKARPTPRFGRRPGSLEIQREGS